jgi:hypothetical protein
MDDEVLHIAIDVSFADEQIQGHVSDGVRAPRAFSGWLGLIGELDGMLAEPGQGDATPSASTPEPEAPTSRGEQARGEADGAATP